MNFVKKYKPIVFVTVLTGLTITSLAMRAKLFKVAEIAPLRQPVIKPMIPYTRDTMLVKKMEDVLATLDPGAGSFTVAGRVNITDDTDTRVNMNNVPFVFSKVGSDYYYRMGAEESINSGQYNIVVNTVTKRIFISAAKKMVGFNMLSKEYLAAVLSKERYDISVTANGSQKRYALTNMLNSNCKEYAVSFDTVANRITRIYSRMAGTGSHLMGSDGRVIDIALDETAKQADLSRYTSFHDVLDKQEKPKAQYKDYKIIHL
jgi:hypothetical protein